MISLINWVQRPRANRAVGRSGSVRIIFYILIGFDLLKSEDMGHKEMTLIYAHWKCQTEVTADSKSVVWRVFATHSIRGL